MRPVLSGASELSVFPFLPVFIKHRGPDATYFHIITEMPLLIAGRTERRHCLPRAVAQKGLRQSVGTEAACGDRQVD